MYAVIQTGGKQYKVSPGEVLRVEKLDAEVGAELEIPEVLLVADGADVKVGTPLVEAARVKARVVEHGRHPKVIVFKKKRRQGYKVKKGHRQAYTAIEIQEISA
ncbi:50S ribosomal protein L21 [Dissulfurirhabdus thermomarina]|uniref:Large ribosomal subunit protein bL21 n=1 Tax=Dissulfurirhabdus thermomarina TaxID=1765737 RepID=A0A6N9TQ71_DISTH|nr:50S ribosomal protein L21 [Dissulfurirhabdus thermomarina]NDY41884.1 50S ribosomal protein L21 [Dissulfurirhabdus thermomarina]NMX22585.1 50S ribosomal protein L21 [Dissulfurirhabdus thermomarina]